MGSSEIADSGRFSGGRSNFSQTCSLLSQYLKAKGSFGDLSFGLTHNLEPKGATTETMNLLPMIEKSGQSSGSRKLNAPPSLSPQQAAGKVETQMKSDLSCTKNEAETAQMTIFYGGQVIVFNDFPADKAEEIMMLAGKSSAAQNRPNAPFTPLESAINTPHVVPTFGIQEAPLDSDLPIARKNSLARFLEKRRDRVTANAPYPRNKPAAPANSESEAWLGLAAQLPLQIQRH